ncbi:Tumor necrosis factor ligand superfamily member 10 [Acipenser ruthenus]|uniref:Tumor necrosis factor ligand superfamily member 10 n=1 Tax=Acipenser ruthenus TaxID=7906 RepID=A0A444UZ31_ACIRT|nr:Tumor necrosis factor ligand superfamily member 10 [Acipenser ruthenus]
MVSKTPPEHNYRQLKEKLFFFNKEAGGKWNTFVIVLSLLLGAEIFGTAYLFFHFAMEIKQTRELVKSGDYPLRCLQYLVDQDFLERKLPNSGDSACDQWLREAEHSINKQLKSDIRNTLYRELTAQNVSLTHFRKPAIHLGPDHLGRQFRVKLTGEDTGGHKLQWDNIEGMALQQGMMGYEDGEIVVPRDGVYFIYSQVYFRVGPRGKDQQSQPFLQYIYRKTSYQDPILLSKAVGTKCWDAGAEFDLFSSFQGALFQLAQGDRLFLKVTDISTVRLNKESTYFGAFMVF